MLVSSVTERATPGPNPDSAVYSGPIPIPARPSVTCSPENSCGCRLRLLSVPRLGQKHRWMHVNPPHPNGLPIRSTNPAVFTSRLSAHSWSLGSLTCIESSLTFPLIISGVPSQPTLYLHLLQSHGGSKHMSRKGKVSLSNQKGK